MANTTDLELYMMAMVASRHLECLIDGYHSIVLVQHNTKTGEETRYSISDRDQEVYVAALKLLAELGKPEIPTKVVDTIELPRMSQFTYPWERTQAKQERKRGPSAGDWLGHPIGQQRMTVVEVRLG